MIQWDSQFELGIESIDNQHKHLIEVAAELSDLLLQAKEGDDIYDGMVEIIDRLKAYTIYHFDFEEKLFEVSGYSGREVHAAEHRKLVADLEAIDLSAIDEDQVVYGKQLLKFLISWIFKHISGSDFLYKDEVLPFVTEN